MVQEPPQRRPAPLQPRDLHERPAPDRRGHHVRVRRAHHAAELPRLPGGVPGADPALGRAVHHRALPAHGRARRQALPGPVRRDPGRPVRGPAPQGLPRPRRHELRRLRHRRGAGEGEPRHDRALVQRGTAGEQAAAPAGHLRTGRHLHRHRERRGHLRLRLPHPGGPQLGVLPPHRPVQPLRRQVQARLRPAAGRLRLLRLPELLAGLHPPPVQGQGDGLGHPDLDPQRALRGEDGRRRPARHRGRQLLRVQGRDPGATTTPRASRRPRRRSRRGRARSPEVPASPSRSPATCRVAGRFRRPRSFPATSSGRQAVSS